MHAVANESAGGLRCAAGLVGCLGRLLAVCGILLLLTASLDASAQLVRPFTVRYSTNVNGDIKLIGNTSMTCSTTGTNGGTCLTGRAGTGANLNNNNFSMVHDNTSGDATTFNATSSNLNIPATATILYAALYWGGNSGSAQRGQVLFKPPGAGGFTPVNALQVDSGNGTVAQFTTTNYSAVADVTALVKAGGVGYYTVANVQSDPQDQTWGGWGMAVAYQDNAQALRNLVIYDGYSVINAASGAVTVTPTGFLTPLSGPIVTRVGSMGWDGDLGSTGDNLAVNGTNLTDALNTTNNYFNSSLSDLGSLATTNIPSYSNQLGVDVDRSNVPAGVITNGATSATITATSTGETYYLALVTFSTDIYVPIITPNLSKTVTDLNGGYLMSGDVVRWTMSMNNTGLDSGINLVLSDPIPNFTTYVPNSLRIISGANAGAKTDVSGDDQAEKTGALNSAAPVVFRLGTGANTTQGGVLAYGQATSLSFDTVLGAVTAGTQVTNTASITYSGQTLSSTSFSSSSSAATLTVLGPPTISKSFNPSSIAAGGTSQLSIVVSNPAANPATLTGIVVADTYPAGITNAATPNPQIVCTPGSTPGTLTGGTAGGNTIGMNPGASIPANGTCTITVNVTGVAGNYTNTTNPVTSSNGGTGTSASANLAVGKITIVKSFSPNPVYTGVSSTMTLTLTNNTGAAATGIAFTDTYPPLLVNASPTVIVGNCGGGTVTAVAGAGSMSLTGGGGGTALAAGASCTITVAVQSATGGIYNNTTSGVTRTGDAVAGNPSNTASLTVIGAPTITKNFSPAVIPVNGVSTLSFVINNPNTTTTVTATAAFSDTYPGTIVNTNPRSVTLNCSTGSSATLSGGAAGGNTIGISTLSLAPGGTCTLTSSVTATAAASLTNNVPVGSVAYTNAPSAASNTAPLLITANPAPTVTKAFGPAATIPQGGTSTMTITITAGAGAALTGLSFTDTYPGNLQNNNAVSGTIASNTCGGTATPSANSTNPGTLTLTGGTLAASSSCTITTLVTSSVPGTVVNATGPVSSANAPQGASANGTLTVVSPPIITKSFGTNPVASGANSLMTITITNPPQNAVNLAGVSFTDTYPAGLQNNSGGTFVSNTCTSAPAVSANATNPGTLSLTGAALGVGGSCTITVNVQSGTGGVYTNTTGAVSSTTSGPGLTASATLTVGKLTIAKSFSPNLIPSGGTSTLTFLINNGTGAAVTGLAFTDTLTNMQLANGTVGGSCTGVTSNAAAGVTAFAVTAGSVPIAGCTITVTVTSTTPGVQPNTSSGATRTGDAVPGAPSNTATLTVTPPPTVTKSFAPSAVGVYVSPATQTVGTNVSTLTLSFFNPNSSSATGANFTDVYPANLVNAAVPAVTNTCGGTVTAAAGAGSISLSGGTLPLNSICTITVNVLSSVAGTYVNNIAAGALTSSQGSNTIASSATLNVLQPLTVSKAFTPGSIGTGATSQLSITLVNPNASPITGVAFVDTYPAGLTNASPAAAGTSCSGATVTTPATNQVQLSGATVPANSSCSVTVNVTAAAAGSYLNTVAAGAVTSSNSGSNTAPASDTLLVGRPRIDKAFSPNPILPGGVSTLTFTLTNPNPAAMTAATFTDTFPTTSGAMVVAPVPNVVNNCGGSVTNLASTAVVAGNTGVKLTGGTIPASGSCTVSVNITGPASGLYVNTATAYSTNVGTGNNSIATLTAMAGPSVTKAFAPAVVGINQPSVLTITLSNPNNFAITGAGFTDTYPANLVNSTSPGGATTCNSGSVTAANGGSSVALAGATIPANGSCLVTVNVVGTAAGPLTNTIAIGAVTSTNAPASVGPAASAILTVLNAPTSAKAFAPATLNAGANSTLTITLTNPNTTAITGASFTDTYPSGLVNAAAPAAATTCASGTVIAVGGGGSVALTGATIPASGSCTVTITVTAPSGGAYFNNTGPISTGNAGSGAGATATLTTTAALVVNKSFGPPPVVATTGTAILMTIVITNPNPIAINGITFTDAYPAGLRNSNGTILSNGCTLPVTATGAGTTPGTLTVTAASVPAGSSCTITINVQSATAGVYTNCVPSFTPTNAPATVQSCANLTVGAATNSPPSITKAFATNPMSPGGTSVLTFTIRNNSTNAATALAFDDTYPVNLFNTNPATVVNTGCGGAITGPGGVGVPDGNGGIHLAGGALAAGATCTITTVVTTPVSGIYNNTTGAVAATVNGATQTGNTTSAALVVSTPASIAKAFSPTTITSGGTSTITFTLTNPTAGAFAGATFTDTLTGMAINAGGAAGGTCAGASGNSFAAGATSLSFTGLTIPANASCTVTVVVVSSTPGALPNATSGVTVGTVTGPPSNTATLTVNAGAPSITKAFSPSTIAAGTNTTMTLTITNPNAVALTGMSFTDGMTNMALATTPAVGGTCAGVSTSAAGGATSFTVTAGTIPASGSCTVTVQVTSNVVGTWPNITSGVTTTQTPVAGSQSNTANLTVLSSGNPVSGIVYNDANGNGTLDNSENWAAGTPVFVNIVSAGVVLQSISVPIGTGAYSFSNIPVGNYTIVLTNSNVNVTAVAPAGWQFTGPTDGTITMSVGTTASLSWNFGLRLGQRISGKVFRDTGAAPLGTTPNNGILDTNEAPANPQNPALLAAGVAGVTVNLYNNATCTGAAAATTTTDASGNYIFGLPASGSVCVQKVNPTGYQPTGASVNTTALPSAAATVVSGTTYTYCRPPAACGAQPIDTIVFTGVANTAYTNLNFGVVPSNNFVADQTSQSPPGTTVNYAHTYTPGTVGSVTFTSAGSANPASPAWSEVLYRDLNCNAVLDGTEGATVIGGTPIAVDPNDTTVTDPNGRRICIIVREFVPQAAPIGASSKVTVSAAFTYTNANPALNATLTVVDTTLSGSATGGDGLRLRKEVCNITQTVAPGCVPAVTGANAGNGFSDNNVGKSGDELMYRIIYSNASSNNLGTLVINDATPPYTVRSTLTAPAYSTTPAGLTNGTVTGPAAGASGGFNWTFTGNLTPNAQGVVTFTVQIQ